MSFFALPAILLATVLVDPVVGQNQFTSPTPGQFQTWYIGDTESVAWECDYDLTKLVLWNYVDSTGTYQGITLFDTWSSSDSYQLFLGTNIGLSQGNLFHLALYGVDPSGNEVNGEVFNSPAFNILPASAKPTSSPPTTTSTPTTAPTTVLATSASAITATTPNPSPTTTSPTPASPSNTAAAGGSSGLAEPTIVGLGVGLGLGVPLIILGTILASNMIRRRGGETRRPDILSSPHVELSAHAPVV